MLRIGIDAMGGDNAPRAIVEGAVVATTKIADDSKVILFGDKNRIETLLEDLRYKGSQIEIVHTTEVIEMGDHPAQVFVKKPDSSIVAGFNYLKEGKIDGFASAGSTGAMMVGCMYSLKQIEGVIRPTISTEIPNIKGGNTLLLDVGLNVDCKPEVLKQYALFGTIYAQKVMKISNPKVALLNIGEEREKGNIATKASYELIESNDRINFVGNVESKAIFLGEADVIVCDGFVGNSILKMVEGFYSLAMGQGIKDGFIDRLNYERIGGTPVLGVNGTVIVGHGCSTALAIENMIIQTERTVKSNMVEALQEIFK